ncbi:putative uncharacterized protein [Parachlamydia acanthamoebae UV-7]|jgi:hypothetical protein|uniref:Transposase IS4-like domain-containing protein n=2 Tax=Parachlamydia acanthamoebae TaxID=83552 RepID=F8KYS8_PARAV|nr:hypothetical protein pah_c050o056 [Parachlamydia acanthamoebae str. Hall's coccus]KIA78254.1 hypothetical protein DB43_EJ00250 [Parachlamydia acanthamoebae]CCB86035.1 putative uncharacterized protein [Parachlamydia acanthamoebae UV-7]
MQAKIVIADKVFRTKEKVIIHLKKAGKGIVILSRRNAKEPMKYDKHHYKARHLIENFFAN